MKIRAHELTAVQAYRKTALKTIRKSVSGADRSAVPPGQERALQSLDFGLSLDAKGYNIFLTGPMGSGRTTCALKKLQEKASAMAAPADWVYVYDFDRPAEPKAISLPAGEGPQAQSDCEKAVEALKSVISGVFEQKDYENAKSQKIGEFQGRIERLMEEAQAQAKEKDFLIRRTPQGFVNIPLKRVSSEAGEEELLEIEAEEFESLPAEEKSRLKTISDDLSMNTLEVLRRIREQERTLKDALEDMESELCRRAVHPCVEELCHRYAHSEKFAAWLQSVERQAVKDRSLFASAFRDDAAEADFSLYRVNVLVSHDPHSGAPVLWEKNPTFYNMAGRMEYESRQGSYWTDFTRLTAGSLHRANGGFLLLNAEDLLSNPMSYELLKRVLRSGELTFENLSEQFMGMSVEAPRPEPVPLHVKVLLVGSEETYYMLKEYDPEFISLFKIFAEFDDEMSRTAESESLMAGFIKRLAAEEGCLPLTDQALTELIEWSSRLAEDQTKLSLRVDLIKSYVIEASAWARREGASKTDASHVLKAVTEKKRRSGLTDAKIRQSFSENIVRIDADGSAVGQINGLAVVDMGDFSFGYPSRITANTYMGQEGIVNIEREITMAGPIHNKGVLTLGSYLGRVYAQNIPLSLSARITFEQNYGEIEGDSASSTELYCLLSSLSGLPIAQNIAVTGSVDQLGNIQPIGGVNEKIEGFFFFCQERGLTGSQGVMIPQQNERHLMLCREVTEAIRKKKFHVWSVRTIDEGIELLTGVPAGTLSDDGSYPAKSVHGLALKKLEQWLQRGLDLSAGKKSVSGASRRRARRAEAGGAGKEEREREPS